MTADKLEQKLMSTSETVIYDGEHFTSADCTPTQVNKKGAGSYSCNVTYSGGTVQTNDMIIDGNGNYGTGNYGITNGGG
jgi:hypothetical protein